MEVCGLESEVCMTRGHERISSGRGEKSTRYEVPLRYVIEVAIQASQISRIVALPTLPLRN